MPNRRDITSSGSFARATLVRAASRETLADVLVAVIDADGAIGERLLRREQWAKVLGVSEGALTHWTQGAHVPTPRNLRAILDVAHRDVRFKPAVDRLEALLDVPLESIGLERTKDEPLGTTLRHQLVAPIRNAFLTGLDTLPPTAQERVLFEAARLVREARSAASARVVPAVSMPRVEAARAQVRERPMIDDVGAPAIWNRAEPNEAPRVADFAALYRTARATRNDLAHSLVQPTERAELTLMLFSFLAVEAYLNKIGAELVPAWPQVEPKLSAPAKLDFLDKSLELKLDTHARPFDALVRMFRFWKTAVHATPDLSVEIASVKQQPQSSDAAAYVTVDDALRVYEDAGEMIRKIHRHLERSGDPLAVVAAGR